MGQKKENINLGIGLNLVIFILELYASMVQFCGTDLLFVGEGFTLGSGLNMFYWFTIDSNILLGVSSLLMMCFYIRYKRNKKAVPRGIHYFKLMSTSATTLTFIVTFIFLLPSCIFSNSDVSMLFVNANVFYHVVCPLLGLVSVVFGSFKHLRWYYGFLFMVPSFIYAPVYLCGYLFSWGLFYMDFYGFFSIWGGFVVPILVFAISFLCGLIVIKLNNIFHNCP